ncbi:hypothetical protein [Paraburkholderia unamae]|nr:hypothetical protein [Paraburkholderia unamae]
MRVTSRTAFRAKGATPRNATANAGTALEAAHRAGGSWATMR